jgi:hypothetical protein
VTGRGPITEELDGRMSNEERIRRVRSRILRAHSALERAAVLARTNSHVETVETALVQAIAEVIEAEKMTSRNRCKIERPGPPLPS